MSTYRRLSDLPDRLPVFPLPGAVLYPRWALPLNIFEPRYLNMIDDALSGARMIGMLQSFGGPRERPELASIGCAGRLTSYAETGDGRYMITLTGICRFHTGEELQTDTPYRQVRPLWADFAADLKATPPDTLASRARLIAALKAYTVTHAFSVDWSAVESAPPESLVHALCSGCPFSALEKQTLLEAPTLAARADRLIALLLMDMPQSNNGPLQ